MSVLITGGRNIVCTDNRREEYCLHLSHREGGILFVLITGGKNIVCTDNRKEEYCLYW